MALRLPWLSSGLFQKTFAPLLPWSVKDDYQGSISLDSLINPKELAAIVKQAYQSMKLLNPDLPGFKVNLKSLPIQDLLYQGGVVNKSRITATGDRKTVQDFLNDLKSGLASQSAGGIQTSSSPAVNTMQVRSSSTSSKGVLGGLSDGVKSLGLLAGLLLAISWISTRRGDHVKPMDQWEAVSLASHYLEGKTRSAVSLKSADRRGHGWNMMLAVSDGMYSVAVADSGFVTEWRRV